MRKPKEEEVNEILSDPKFRGISQKNRNELIQRITSLVSFSKTHSGPLPDYGSEGYRFESCRGH